MISDELALVKVVLKALTEQLDAAKGNADAEVATTARPGDRTNAVLPDGTVVGVVGFTKGRTTVQVTDRAAFTQWVRDEYPDEIDMVPTVRPAFEKGVLEAIKVKGANVDRNGIEVPGVRLGQGSPYPTTKVEKGAEDAIAAAYQSGQLAEVMERFTRPAIEAGEQS